MEQFYGKVNTNRDEDKIIIFKNATFSWDKLSKRIKRPLKDKRNKGKSKKNLSKGYIQRRDSSSSSEGSVQMSPSPDRPFVLKDISIDIGKGEMVGITGNLGSGKTSLLLAIIGEMLKKKGELQVVENLNSKFKRNNTPNGAAELLMFVSQYLAYIYFCRFWLCISKSLVG